MVQATGAPIPNTPHIRGEGGGGRQSLRLIREQQHKHTQTHNQTSFNYQPNPISYRKQRLKYAARAHPHALILKYINIGCYWMVKHPRYPKEKQKHKNVIGKQLVSHKLSCEIVSTCLPFLFLFYPAMRDAQLGAFLSDLVLGVGG